METQSTVMDAAIKDDAAIVTLIFIFIILFL